MSANASTRIAWLVSLCGVAGCNALLDNVEHDVGDASQGATHDAATKSDAASSDDDDDDDDASALDSTVAGDGAVANDGPNDGASDDAADGALLTDAAIDAPHVDAGADSAVADSAPVGVPCASRNPAPLFCDDFDQGTTNSLWSSVHTTEGNVVVDSVNPVSSPHSMLVTVDVDADPNVLDVAGIKNLPGGSTTGKCTLAFDLRIDAAATTSGAVAVLGAIEVNGGSSTWDLELEVSYQTATSSFGLVLLEIPPQVAHATTQTLPMGTWARVEMSIALPPAADGSANASLVVNGKNALTTTVHVLPATQPTGSLVAYVGTNFATRASSGWAIRYDDVTFDLR